jgi:geranylgeranyl diphosphate synthase type II
MTEVTEKQGSPKQVTSARLISETVAEDRKRLAAHLESYFERYIGTEGPAHHALYEAMQYSLKAGGKRIRPVLLLQTCKAFGGSMERAMPFAAAIEMIHTYSLIHDDLPCMDDDDLRRGKPTNHVVFGEDMAVLAGDGLLNLAAETMAGALLIEETNVKSIRAMHEILKASGSNGMILGQVADIKYGASDMTLEKLDFINANKTGKLLTAALVAGALLGGADDESVEKMRRIGYEMGLLFQVVDDVLDLIGDPEKLGKRTQMDVKNEKCTYPMLIGIEGAKAQIVTYTEHLMDMANDLPGDMTYLKAMIQYLAERDR